MKYILSFIICACMILSCSTITYASESDNPSVEITPIYSKSDLWNIRADGHYILMNDLTYTEDDFKETSSCFWRYGWQTKFNTFTGSFDGNGFTIRGLKINTETNSHLMSATSSGVGFFAENAGLIKNLTLCDINFTNKDNLCEVRYFGAFAARNRGTIEQCNLICKSMLRLSIYNQGAGGIVGNNSGTIYKCKNQCQLTAYNVRKNSGYSRAVGGIAASNSGSIICCANYASVLAVAHSDSNRDITCIAGGISASSLGTIDQCYNEGNIFSSATTLGKGTSTVCSGGIVGNQSSDNQYPGLTNNCYNYGTLSSTGTYPFSDPISVGSGKIQNCYSTNGQFLQDFHQDLQDCYVFSSDKPCTITDFNNWDFENIWCFDFDSQTNYPVLRWDTKNAIGMNKSYLFMPFNEDILASKMLIASFCNNGQMASFTTSDYIEMNSIPIPFDITKCSYLKVFFVDEYFCPVFHEWSILIR